MAITIVQSVGTAAPSGSSQPKTNWPSAPTFGNLMLALGFTRNQIAPAPINGWSVYSYNAAANWQISLYYKYALAGTPQVEAIDGGTGYQEWAFFFWETHSTDLANPNVQIEAVHFSPQGGGASTFTNATITTLLNTLSVLSGFSGQFPNGSVTLNWSGATSWTHDGDFVSSGNNAFGIRNWSSGGHQTVSSPAVVTNTITSSAAAEAWTGGFVELGSGPPTNIRINDLVRETLSYQPTGGRVSEVVRETLSYQPTGARTNFLVRETLSYQPHGARSTLIVRETLVSYPLVPQAGSASGVARVNGVAPTRTGGLSQGHSSVNGVSPLHVGSVGAVVGRSRVLGIAQPTTPQAAQFPFPTLQFQIKSYLYVWCNDDDNLQSMVAAYNAYTQAYLDWFNSINLPVYTGAKISGTLLDWVATYLYGLPRPGLPEKGKPGRGPFNTYELNTLTFNGGKPGTPGTFFVTSDDYYKRILTWLFYKGDGKVFNVRWLKRRIERFLYGINGTDPGVVTTYDLSIQFTGPTQVTIVVPPSDAATILKAAIDAGVLELPFQITWNVVT